MSDYLFLAEYIPDEFIELMRYEDTEKLLKGLMALEDSGRIEKAVKSLADFVSTAIGG